VTEEKNVITEPVCVICEVRDEAEKTIEPRAYTSEHKENAGLRQIGNYSWFSENNKVTPRKYAVE
jgi:hypothetical protein